MKRPQSEHRTILVSACLLGVACRYDGGSKPSAALLAAIEGARIVPVCPEQLGGLATPRVPAEIDRGDGADVLAGAARVVDRDGRDRSAAFIRGAREALMIARLASCTHAVLKERSPSCGVGEISRDGRAVAGRGVCAALLGDAGFTVISDEDRNLIRLLEERHEADL